MAGRKSLYTPQLGELICAELAAGKTLKTICAHPDMPADSTVHSWLVQADKKVFLDSYRDARRVSYEVLAEGILDIARGDAGADDSIKINRDKLEIWATQWYLGKMAPRKYGDKPVDDAVVVTGLDLTKLDDDELDAYVALLNKMKDDQ